ncbi:hypothetical protein B5M09_010394 [Aphanomyces astaci]|uniref:Uncharacterized protein n=1 Tax=Aphanomyces astaci TaxID=112090 RepID=A0A425DFH6_APHAT|nr:hypothetical protein B5M09_010394 [Aphanomyces astaci]
MTMEQCLTLAVKRYLDQNVHATAVFLAERLVAENASEDNLGLLADAYYRSGAGHRAISLLERHMTSNQGILSAHNRYLLALCCFEADRISDAENALIPSMSTRRSTGEGATKNVPNGAAGLYLLGRVHRRLHRTDQAIECFTERYVSHALFMYASFPASFVLPYSIHITLGDDCNAICSLKLDPFLWSSFENLCELGSQASASLFFGGVSTNPSKASTNTSHARGKKALSRTITEQGASHQAAMAFERMRALSPDRLDGVSIYSTTLWHLKKEVDLSYLAQQVTSHKTSAEAWCVAGNCFSLQKEHDVALDFFTRAIQVDPTFPYAYTLAGHEYVSNEDFDKAVACFRQALRVDPRHYNAWCGLGTIYFKQEKLAVADYHFGRAVAINPHSSLLHLEAAAPKDYTVHFTLGSVYTKLVREPCLMFVSLLYLTS